MQPGNHIRDRYARTRKVKYELFDITHARDAKSIFILRRRARVAQEINSSSLS